MTISHVGCSALLVAYPASVMNWLVSGERENVE